MPTPPTPFSTAPMPSKHISTNANISNPLFIYPHTLKTYFTQCQQLTPPFQLPPCPENTFHTVPSPQTPFSTALMPPKHISHSANTSNPLFNCPHAIKTQFTQCQHLKPPFQLPPCRENISHPVRTPHPPFSTAPMPSKHISPSANTSSPLLNYPHALKTHFTEWQHLTPPFQLPPCPQNTFDPVPTPQTPLSTAPMPSKHISSNANNSNPLFNCPHALETYFTQCQHLKRPFQLPTCPQNTFHPVPTPQTRLTPLMPSKHISSSGNTSNPLCNCPHALKTHFTQCQHLKPAFQLPPCRQNIFHPTPTPPTPFSTAPIPPKHSSHSPNTSKPLFNCPHALKTHFTQCQHLKLPFQLPSCPQNAFYPVPTRQTPFSTALMPSEHISPSATSQTPFSSEHISPTTSQTPFSTAPTLSKHISPSANTSDPLFQMPPCPQNAFHPMSTPQTPFSTAPMPTKHTSPSANTSNPLVNLLHADTIGLCPSLCIMPWLV